jgi:hypothetical protein
MEDLSTVKSYFENNNLSYFMFSPKSKKPIKVVKCLLPHNTPAENLIDW